MRENSYQYKWWALIGLSLLSFTAFLDFTIVTTALPFIQKSLNASVIQLQWVTSIFSMLQAMLMITVGKFGDIFGRRKIFYIGFVIFFIAAIGAGVSPTIQWLIFFRAAQGGAAAIIFTLGASLIPQAFPENEHTRAIGVFSAFNGVGLAIGPFISGVLITWLSWRWVFFINIPIIIVGFACCIFSLNESEKQTTKIDWMGFFLLTIGLGCFMFGIVHEEQYNWMQWLTWATIIIGVVSLFALLVYEKRIEHPMLDLTLFKNVHASLAATICVIAGLITFVLFFFDPLYLKTIRNETAIYIGLFLLLIPIVQVIVSLVFNALIRQFGLFNLLVFGGLTGTAAGICHAFFGMNTSIWFIFLAFILMGYTWGIANAGSIAAIMQSVEPKKVGNAIGSIFTLWNVAGSIFLVLSTVIYNAQVTKHLFKYLDQHDIAHHKSQTIQIAKELVSPDKSYSILSNLSKIQIHKLFEAYQSSFLIGFHWMAWFVSILMAIGFIICMALRGTNNRSNHG